MCVSCLPVLREKIIPLFFSYNNYNNLITYAKYNPKIMETAYKAGNCWFNIVTFMGILHTGSALILDNTYTRVVESPVLLICPTAVSDIETVRWKKDASNIPILSYFPKDDYIDPEDHDQRLGIMNDKDLRISSLEFADSGNYTCVITSSTLPEDVTYAIQLEIQVGCLVPVFPDPLTTPDLECGSGSTIGYKSECNFTCPYGYTMTGDMSTECQSNGSLSKSLPECTETSCYIDSVPLSPVNVEGCSQCSRIPYGHSCTFSCDTRYELKGASVVTCLTTGELDSPYPICEETVNEKNLLPLLVLLIIPVIIAGAIILVCMRKKGCSIHTTKDVEKEEAIPLELIENQRIHKVTFKENMDDSPIRSATLPYYLLPRHLKDLFKGFLALLIDQLDMERRPDILQRIHGIESDYILPQILSIDVDHRLKEFINKCTLEEMTRKEAFALYITVLISFIDDKQMTKRAQHEIIAMTGHQDVQNSNIKWEANEAEHLLEDNMSAADYLGIVLKAFAALIKAERSSIDDKHDKNAQTSKVSHMILRFIEKHPGNTTKDDVSSRSKSTVQSFNESNADDEYFAKLCVKEIRQFENMDDCVSLRHNILDVLLSRN